MHFGYIKDIAAKQDRIVVGLDIGTTKVCVVVAEIRDNGTSHKDFVKNGVKSDINIIGTGIAPSNGIKKGVVINIEGMTASIKEAVQQAETASGVHIRAVHVGISGSHISSFSSNGVIAIKGREIGQKEVDSVLEAAKAVAIPFEKKILHVIPVGYTIDGQNGISDPRGMGGTRLETDVRIITATAASVNNLIKSCEKAGLEVLDVIYQPLALAEAVLTDDEKNLGVAVVDIGGGTTDIALFQDGNICHSAVLALGGNNFTNDIAIGLRIPTVEAETIKKKHGCSMITLVKGGDEVHVGAEEEGSGSSIPRSYLTEILQPRAEELFLLIKEEIRSSGYEKYMNSGVVLTGGAVLMEGMDVMAENILELPVRIGRPTGLGEMTKNILSPDYAAGVGLMQYGAQQNIMDQGFEGGNMFSGVTEMMKGWLDSLFK